MVRRLIALLACLALALSLYAQEASTLYRGRRPTQYSFRYNGTYFWESRSFQQGSILYNDKQYDNVLLNIDACQMEVLVRESATSAPVVLYDKAVKGFRMGKAYYVNLRNLGFADAPAGYFELVRDGEKPLLLQVQKIYRTDSGNHNGKDIGFSDPDYQNSVPDYFYRFERYYSVNEGKVVSLRKRSFRKELAKVVPEKPNLRLLAEQWEGTSEPVDLPFEQVKIPGLGLPDGYFSTQLPEAATEAADHDRVVASYRNKVYVIGSGSPQEQVTVSGVVTDMENGQPLRGVVVFDEKTGTYERSAANGRYSITLPGGSNNLTFSSEGKEEISLHVQLLSDGELHVELPDKVELLKASVVSANSMREHRSTTMGVETVSIGTLNKIPTAFGEGDILKGVLALPGVKSVGEASGGFNVRGGSQDQNLILFGSNTIYNPSHLLGVFSAFNPDVLESVELYKSSIPAQYGGRISSVLAVKPKEGSSERVKGSLGIGLLTGRAHLEGPLGKKTNFILGARTSYSDWMLRALPKNSNYSGASAGFTDVNLGLAHHFDANNTLQLTGYFATDRFSFRGDTTFRYTSINGAAQFRHKKADGALMQVSLGYDQYFNRTEFHFWQAGAYDLDTYIRQAFVKASSGNILGNHTLNYGLDVVGYALDPGIRTPWGAESEVLDRSLKREYALEPAIYASDNWEITPHFSVEGGVRLSSFLFLDPNRFYIGPEWRLSARYSPLDNLSIKGGFNTLRQYIHLISNTSAISPIDTWKLSDADIAPTTGWQGAAGIYWTHLGTGLDFSLEGYWKQMSNCLDYKPGATLSMNDHLADELVPVYGKAWGVEAMIKKTTGKLTGWISYSYSRSQFREMQDRGAETLAQGQWYNAPYDKPHEVKFVGNWAFTHRYSLSVNMDYSTGRPYTPPVGKYYLSGAYYMVYAQRNSYRIPDYFRLDLAINVDPGHSQKAFAHTRFTIGVYNVTGRKNPYSIFFNTDKSGNVNGYMLSVFAMPVPYANINILF